MRILFRNCCEFRDNLVLSDPVRSSKEGRPQAEVGVCYDHYNFPYIIHEHIEGCWDKQKLEDGKLMKVAKYIYISERGARHWH